MGAAVRPYSAVGRGRMRRAKSVARARSQDGRVREGVNVARLGRVAACVLASLVPALAACSQSAGTPASTSMADASTMGPGPEAGVAPGAAGAGSPDASASPPSGSEAAMDDASADVPSNVPPNPGPGPGPMTDAGGGMPDGGLGCPPPCTVGGPGDAGPPGSGGPSNSHGPPPGMPSCAGNVLLTQSPIAIGNLSV